MSWEEIQKIAAKYGLKIMQTEMDLLLQIARLPSSEIADLFNDIAIADVFSPKVETLF